MNHAHIVSLMYKLITTARDTDDFSTGFNRDRNRRRELTNNKNIKGKLIRIYLQDIYGFAEHQEKATFGLGYKFKLSRNTDNSILNKANATTVGKIKINAIQWYVPHYTTSILQQAIISKQILSKTPTEL